MSSDTVKQWEEYTESIIKKKEIWPKGTPQVTCLEDLTIAAKAVHGSFENAARFLTNAEGQPCFDAFNKRKYGNPVWYRGDPDWESDWHLCPSVFRPKHYLKSVGGQELTGYKSAEKWMLTEFWRRAVLRDSYSPEPGRLEAWLALAQHHRLPTRFLDWSESILTAAWFAAHDDETSTNERELRDAKRALVALRDALDTAALDNAYLSLPCEMASLVRDCKKPRPTTTVIWALSPALLNWHFERSGPHYILKGSDPIVTDAFDAQGRAPEKVLAVWQQDVHPRMLMQSGVFTVHSTDESLEKLNDGAPPNERFLRKLIVADKARSEIDAGLAAVGVNGSAVYPDLDHLAKEIKEYWAKVVKEIKQDEENAKRMR
jgi:hypothetical protein